MKKQGEKTHTRSHSLAGIFKKYPLSTLALSVAIAIGLAAAASLLPSIHSFLTTATPNNSPYWGYLGSNLLLGYLLLLAIGGLSYLWIDYRQHLRPLKQEMPTIVYTPVHYVRVVFLPRAKYSWKQAVLAFSKMTGGSLVVLVAFVFGFVFFANAAPGTLTVTINQKAGTADPNPSYTSVFTVQFSEPIDKATFTDTDITLGGTAPSQTVQSITEAGSFNKTTYEVRIQATGAGTITPSISQELVTAQDSGTHGTNQASTSTDNTVTYNGDYAPGEFVMTVKTDNPGSSASNQMVIPVHPTPTYNYTVDWGDGNTSTGQIGDAGHTYASAGTYTVKISGTFPRIYTFSAGDRQKLLSVEQWGTNPWTSMAYAFSNTVNLTVEAIDAPNFSVATTTSVMFMNATGFNQNINHWNMSHITNISSMFQGATAFNKPLGDWNVSNVTDMNNVFFLAIAFNQNINDWDVGHATRMDNMFNSAWSFNQPLNSWNTAAVTNFNSMFMDASVFNQNINDWDVTHGTDFGGMFSQADIFNQPLNSWQMNSATATYGMFATAAAFNQNIDSWSVGTITNMNGMFAGAASFNQPLNDWDVSNVTAMHLMFQQASAFDQPLVDWDVSNVIDMSGMFEGATAFNRPLDNWDVSGVADLRYVFDGATSFDQSLGTWNLTGATQMYNFFANGSGLSTSNYDATLVGWSALSLKNNVTFGAGTSKYCASGVQRQSIINTFGWIIYDGGEDCPGSDSDAFITTWKTDNPGGSNPDQITIPTTGAGYNYTVDWGDGNTSAGQSGNATHTYTAAGTYTVSITGTFPRIHFLSSGDRQKFLSVDQWGTNQWASMAGAFQGVEDFVISASDAPDLSSVTDMSSMFEGATHFNSPINGWDVSSVIDMESLFRDASDFNQPLDSWDVSNVINMATMFGNATSFNQELNNWDVSSVANLSWMFANSNYNQPLGDWDVGNVIDMTMMFANDTSFNQPIGNWDVSSVVSLFSMFYHTPYNQPLDSWDVSSAADMSGMFIANTAFNQPLGSWNVSNVTSLAYMFAGSSSFDQSLAGWDVNSAADMSGMFLSEPTEFEPGVDLVPSGLSTPNYDATLISWSQQSLQSTVTFDAGTSQYCTSEVQRQNIIDDKFWVINDSGKNCAVPLGIPQNLTGVPHATSIELNWDDVVDADYYIVQYKPSADSAWIEFTDHFINNSYLDDLTGLQPSTSYDIRVKAATDEGGESDWSDVLTMMTLARQTYHLTNCQQLQAIAIDPITFEPGDVSGNYILDNDIDCSESEGWTWDGMMPPEQQSLMGGFIAIQDLFGNEPFTGNFDGQGHTISNMYQKAIVGGGLFGQTLGSEIKDLVLEDSNISDLVGIPFNGGLAGRVVDSTISNVRVKRLDLSSIRGNSGGLLGAALGATTISESSAEGTIQTKNSPTGDDDVVAGGLLGAVGFGITPTLIEHSYADVAIDIDLTNNGSGNIGLMAGGLTGGTVQGYGVIENSYSHGSIDVNATNEIEDDGFMVGGLSGTLVSVTNSYSATPITIQSNGFEENDEIAIGGLVGASTAEIVNSFAVGPITTDDVLLTPGGLAGALISTPEDIETLITNSYYDKTTTGTTSCVYEAVDINDSSVITPNPTFDCTAVNTDGSQGGYFKNNTTHPPLNQWNFSTIWVAHADKYPDFVSDTIITPPVDPVAPSTPRNPSVSHATTTSLRFNWQAPASNGGSPLTGYQVQYKPASSATWISVPLLGPTITSRTFTGLSSNTTYDFRVLANNAVGSSSYTTPVAGKTLTTTKPPKKTPPSNNPATPSITSPSGSGGGTSPGLTPLATLDTIPAGHVEGAWWSRLSDQSLNLLAWLLIAILLVIGSTYAYQAYREYTQQKAADALAHRLKALRESITNYANTAIHYLNTPLAIMRSSVELAASLKQVPENTLGLLQNKLSHFAQTSQQLGAAVEGDANVLTQASTATIFPASKKWAKLSVWLPVSIAVIFFSLAQLLIISRNLNDNNWLITGLQISCFVGGLGLVFYGSHLRTVRTALKAQAQQNIAIETASLEQRRTFLELAARKLSTEHEDLLLAGKYLPSSPSAKTYQNGLAMLGSVQQSLTKIKNISNPSVDTPMVDVNALLARLDGTIQAFAQQHQVQFVSKVPANLIVQLQPEEADQLLGSLIHNAIKFSKAGGQVTVAGRTSRNKVIVTVRDHGVGMTPEAQSHIFEPFSRGTSAEQFDYDGLGLNMYTNKLITDKLGGEILVNSNNSGTTITVKLPIPHRGATSTPVLVAPTTTPSSAAVIGVG